MADRHCIFAWTETNAPEGYPGYVNISRDENGKHTITVRSRGNAGRDTAIVEIPPEALESLLCDLAADLYRDEHESLMAMSEGEIDVELRRLGIDPAEAERKGKAAVEGALAAIRNRNAGVTATVKESLTAGAPEPQASEHCTWMQDGEADGTWFTDCGHAFNLEAGAPAENKMKFCCYCGKPTRAPGVATRHPRCGYPYCACVGQCFAASQPGAAPAQVALPAGHWRCACGAVLKGGAAHMDCPAGVREDGRG